MTAVDSLQSGEILIVPRTDDCWETKNPPRDPATGQLTADASRFPQGMKALGDYMHAKNVQFALYTAESAETCGVRSC